MVKKLQHSSKSYHLPKKKKKSSKNYQGALVKESILNGQINRTVLSGINKVRSNLLPQKQLTFLGSIWTNFLSLN